MKRVSIGLLTLLLSFSVSAASNIQKELDTHSKCSIPFANSIMTIMDIFKEEESIALKYSFKDAIKPYLRNDYVIKRVHNEDVYIEGLFVGSASIREILNPEYGEVTFIPVVNTEYVGFNVLMSF